MLHGFYFALKMIKRRPLRMSLTLLQIAVGVAAITIVLSFVFSVLDPADQPENSLLYEVRYGQEETRDGVLVSGSYTPAFTGEMVEGFREKSNNIDKLTIIGEDHRGFLESEGVRYLYKRMLGTDSYFPEIFKLKMEEGSFFTRADLESSSGVIVISRKAREQLFGSGEAVGRTVRRIPAQGRNGAAGELRIIGVYFLEDNPQQMGGTGIDFILPYTTLYSGSKMPELFSRFWVLFKEGRVGAGKDELTALFNQEVGDQRFQREEYNLLFREVYAGNLQLRQMMARSFGLFIGSFAFIAFVVSFIGILSMMLVSIVERTREIGLRRALGATRMSIFGQILSEAMLVSLLGGMLGIVLAYFCIKPVVDELILGGLFSYLSGISAALSLYPVMISLGGVVVVGLIAGLYPGFQASRLSPVEAIAEEVR